MENKVDDGDEVIVNADLLVSEYGTFINEILKRLNAVSESLSEITANPDHPENWKNCDFCWFEIRKVCEYMASAIVLAHHRDSGDEIELQNWKPKDLLAQVDKLSHHPRFVAISSVLIDHGESRQITPLAKPIDSKIISEIYGRCSELLHVGSLKRLLESKLPSYDTSQLEVWLLGFTRLMQNHALLLPKVKRILVCFSQFEFASAPEVFLMAGEGEGLFDMANLPEFELAAS
jgi:hypothetical protein